jgi:hypothetical protein
MATISSAKRSRKNRAFEICGPGGPWTGHAPHRVREVYQGDASEEGWALWRKHLAKRKLRPVAKRFKGAQSPLFWAVPRGLDVEAAVRIVELLRRPRLADRRTAGLDNAALCWLSRAEVAAFDYALALECLAWCADLPALAEHLGQRAWWQLANRLIAIAASDPRGDDPLARQMLHGELAATLAYVLPELAASRTLIAASRRTLEESSDAPFDGAGMIHGTRLDALRPLVACWTRWRTIAQRLDDRLWTEAAPRRFARLLEHALRLTRRDRTQLFSPPDSDPWNRRLLKTALRLADSAKTRRLARLIASGGKGSRNPTRRAPSPSFDANSAGVAVLRASWRRTSPLLAVNYSGPQMALEFSIGREPLLRGAARLEVRVDGSPVVARQPWEPLAWETDDELDYLELELRLSEDIVVQRHLVLARDAGFLFLADAVLGTCSRQFEYRATLPLAPEVSFQAEKETREGTLLADGRPRARVLPLALSEWRGGASYGTLESQDGLQLAQSATGRALFAPLFLDFDRRRLRREVTWRQLTVAQDRQVVPRDVAVGYRVQIGNAQWVLYRSLGPPAVRTVLSKNLMHEFLLGRFTRKGNVKTLLEIEA